jgi:hypothetical protein
MGGRRYQYFYYFCSGYNSHGLKGCEEARFASATKLEGQVWEFVRGILLDPAELRSDLDRAIELEKEGRYGDPEAEAKHCLEKLSEIDEERRGFLRLAAKGRITDEELAALEETRRTAERDLKDLRQHKELVGQMEQDRDALLEHYASLAPEAPGFPHLRRAPPSLQDAQAQGLVGQERGFRDGNGRRAGRWVGREFFHNAGHIEGNPSGNRCHGCRGASSLSHTARQVSSFSSATAIANIFLATRARSAVHADLRGASRASRRSSASARILAFLSLASSTENQSFTTCISSLVCLMRILAKEVIIIPDNL